MRILNVTQSYFPFEEFGGPPAKVRALSEQLSKRGHQMTVLTADWGLETRGFIKAITGLVERSPFGWRCEANGVEAIYLPTWLRYRALSWNPGAAHFCRARLWNFDVVHIFGLYDLLGPVVAAACRRGGTPYVVEPIGMFVPIVRNFRLKRMYHLALGQPMLRGSRAIIATSAQEAAELASAGLAVGKIALRRNGVDAPKTLPERGKFRASHGIPRESKLVLYLGRLSPKKSPDLLVQAFAPLCKAVGGAAPCLVFAGPDEGGMKRRLQKMARDLGVEAQVQFCGAVFGDAKWSAYRDADVFVLSSQNENFGNAAGEAVAAGTPVVVTDRCGIAPLLGNAALVVAHDAHAVSEALRRVLFEPRVHAWMSSGCREAAARLDWEEPAKEMERVYSQLVRSEGQPTEVLH